jgi:hypothetical protein
MQSEVSGQGPIVRLASYGKQDLNFSLHGHNFKQESPCGPSGCGLRKLGRTRLRSKRKDFAWQAHRNWGRAKGIYSHDDARRGTLDLFEFGL